MHIVVKSITHSSLIRSHLTAIAALTLLLAALYGYAFIVDDYTHWDSAINNWVQAQRTPAMDRLMLAATLIADLKICTALIFGFALLLLIERHYWLSCYLLTIFFSTTLSVIIFKHLAQRSRPALLESTQSLTSFPSGHAARAVLAFGIVALLLSWGRSTRTRHLALLTAGVASLLVAVSRVYLGVHWTSDVLAGATLAAVMLIGFHWQLLLHDKHLITLPIGRVLVAVIVAFTIYYFYAIEAQSQGYAATGMV